MPSFKNLFRIENDLKKIFHNSSVLLFGNVGASLCGLLSLTLLTRSVGADAFGHYVLILTSIEILERVFNFQTWQAFIKFASDLRQKSNNSCTMLIKYCFLIDFVSLAIAYTVGAIFLGQVLSFFNLNSSHTFVVQTLLPIILCKTFDLSLGIFRLFNRFSVQRNIDISTSFAKLILFGIVTLTAPTIEYFALATLLSQLTALILKACYTAIILKEHGICIADIAKERIDFQMIKQLGILPFIVYNNFDISIKMVSRKLDIIALGKFYQPELVGLYKISREIAGLVNKVTEPIYQAIYPELARLVASGDNRETWNITAKLMSYLAAGSLLFYIVFVLIGELALVAVFGPDYLPAYGPTLVYMIGVIIALISNPLYPLQHAFGNAKDAFINQFKATLIYAPILFFLVCSFSLFGACYAYIVYVLFLTWFTSRSIRRSFELRTPKVI